MNYIAYYHKPPAPYNKVISPLGINRNCAQGVLPKDAGVQSKRRGGVKVVIRDGEMKTQN